MSIFRLPISRFPQFPQFPDFPISRIPISDFPVSRFPNFPISQFPDFPISRLRQPDVQISQFPDFRDFRISGILRFPAHGGPISANFGRRQKKLPIAQNVRLDVRGLLLLPAACLLLDAQARPQWSTNLTNRPKYFVLQLADPNPNQDLVLGPS